MTSGPLEGSGYTVLVGIYSNFTPKINPRDGLIARQGLKAAPGTTASFRCVHAWAWGSNQKHQASGAATRHGRTRARRHRGRQGRAGGCSSASGACVQAATSRAVCARLGLHFFYMFYLHPPARSFSAPSGPFFVVFSDGTGRGERAAAAGRGGRGHCAVTHAPEAALNPPSREAARTRPRPPGARSSPTQPTLCGSAVCDTPVFPPLRRFHRRWGRAFICSWRNPAPQLHPNQSMPRPPSTTP